MLNKLLYYSLLYAFISIPNAIFGMDLILIKSDLKTSNSDVYKLGDKLEKMSSEKASLILDQLIKTPQNTFTLKLESNSWIESVTYKTYHEHLIVALESANATYYKNYIQEQFISQKSQDTKLSLYLLGQDHLKQIIPISKICYNGKTILVQDLGSANVWPLWMQISGGVVLLISVYYLAKFFT